MSGINHQKIKTGWELNIHHNLQWIIFLNNAICISCIPEQNMVSCLNSYHSICLEKKSIIINLKIDGVNSLTVGAHDWPMDSDGEHCLWWISKNGKEEKIFRYLPRAAAEVDERHVHVVSAVSHCNAFVFEWGILFDNDFVSWVNNFIPSEHNLNIVE